MERKFPGFILTLSLLIRVSPQAIARFKDQVRARWDARQAMTSEQLRDQWSNYQRGLLARPPSALLFPSSSVGLLRPGRGTPKRPEPERLDTPPHQEMLLATLAQRQRTSRRPHPPGNPPKQREVASSSRGAWCISGSPAMQHALNNRVLKKHGFITPSDLAG